MIFRTLYTCSECAGRQSAKKPTTAGISVEDYGSLWKPSVITNWEPMSSTAPHVWQRGPL
jgi:hypothetical protein